MKTGLRYGFCFLTLTALFLLLQGCDIAKNAGQKAAEIIARDVIPQLTGESAEWRKLADETINKLPQEFRHQFDLAFQRAVDAAGAEYKCDVDFLRSRLRQDLEAMASQWRGEGPVPSPDPHFCNVYPNMIIELDENGKPKDQNWILYYGYDFMDFKNKPLVKVFLEYTDGKTLDLTDCCLDNPTHYNLTVDFDEVGFTTNTRRLLLKSPDGVTMKSIGINHAPPKPAPPVEEPGRFLVNKRSGKCLDVEGTPGVDNGAKLQIWDCEFGNQASDQIWKITKDGFIQNKYYRCLDVKGNPGVNNEDILQLWDCELNDAKSDQIWKITSDGFIQNQYGRCIDVEGTPGINNGDKLQLWDCEFNNSNTDQQWEWK